jgi:hypothetical protein
MLEEATTPAVKPSVLSEKQKRTPTWKFKYGVIVRVLEELDISEDQTVGDLLGAMKEKTLDEVLAK